MCTNGWISAFASASARHGGLARQGANVTGANRPGTRLDAAYVRRENSGGARNSCAGERAEAVVRGSQGRLARMITERQEVYIS
jgi:hypothetical protein